MRILLCLTLVIPLRAADPLPGHSVHGEAFDEGPRQAAVLIEGCGKINFPITTKNPDAQKFFNQGVGQLHGFWYFEAERSFRQVALLDADCAMAYWGCAMANVNNAKRAASFIKKASEKKSTASKREQAWIGALENFYADLKKEKKTRQMGLIKDIEDIASDFPDDLEAKAFLGWAIWHAKEDSVPMVSRETVDALLKQVFAKEPAHPAHHYIIHLWDDSKPARAVKSAAQCGQAAPAIAHMWHMPGHTFSKVNRLDDAAWQQEAATRVDHAYMIRTQIVPDQIHNYAHNTEWLIRTLNQTGQGLKAAALAKNFIEIPRHPVFNKIDNGNKSAGFGRTRLLETLLKFGLWDEMAALDGSPWLDVTQNPSYEANRFRALGVAAFFKNDLAALDKNIAALTSLKAKEAAKSETKKDPAPVKSESKPDEQKNKRPPPRKNTNAIVDNGLAELRAVRAIADGRNDDATKLLTEARDTPKDRVARYQLRMGDKEKAAQSALQLPQDAPGLALRVEVLAACGKTDEAKKHFEFLRTTGAMLENELPVAKRMDEFAMQNGIDKNWRKPQPVRADSGVRPPMETLGPLHWHPWHASSFTLPNHDGQQVALNDFAGKPVVVLFYLGNVCGHCMEQLKAFSAAAKDFEKAGIKLVAIGSEPIAQLATTGSTCGQNGAEPFPLLADPAYKVFREWRCYDDFEKTGLHGAFLVDEHGMVRWADVSYDPFKDTRFLLEESKRLLKFKQTGGAQ